MSTMRRRHRIVCSSEEEEEEVVQSVPRPRQPPQAEHEHDSATATLNFQTVTLNSTPTPSAQVANCPVGLVLQEMGLLLRVEWLESCIGQLEGSVPGFTAFDPASKAKHCFKQFLYSDMNFSGAGGLPPDVHTLHSVDLKGPFVLQVDEIVNISCPLRGRYHEAPAGFRRCLKLSMTDGIQRVFGMEYRPLKGLNAMAPAGIKVAICNVNVRHGLLMLVPEVFEILGGMVDELEGARQRLVSEVNKPARGKRTRNGDDPPLATRSTLAAWPLESANTPERPDSFRGHDQTTQFQGRAGTLSGIHASNGHGDIAAPIRREDAQTDLSFVDAMDVSDTPASNSIPHNESMDADEIDSVDARIGADTLAQNRTQGNIPVHIMTVDSESDELPTAALDDELGHPFVLSGDKETPFTYLASLSAKWASAADKTSSVKGKIKCFLTGVKGFQYKGRSTYELRVYVDDGSLISEILIDHNVVQKGIGYSPMEVTSALASSDRRLEKDMKETMKQFQRFLVNFEGTMVVEMGERCPTPVATEMNQGCPASDAWLLLRRLQPYTSAQLQSDCNIETIYLSP